MGIEQSTIESGEKPKTEQEVVIEAEKSPEEIEKEMLTDADKEVASFEREEKSDLESVEKKASVDGLQIDTKDRSELEELIEEAEQAKKGLVKEIGGEDESKKNINNPNIIEIAEDKNFEGSTIIKTKDAEGRIIGYALRKNSRGDLEGNEIGYMEDGSVGPVYQLHESDFAKLKQQGVMESYENVLAQKNKDSEREQLNKVKEFSKEYSQEDRNLIAKEIFKKRKEYFDGKKNIEADEQDEKQIVEQLEKLGDDIESHRDIPLSKEQYLKETKEIINNFYSNENKKWLKSKEEIAENFSEENLASLSMENYIDLLRKFPGHLVTHVTRQGVRSKEQSFAYHSKGVGQFKNGFKDMLKSKKLVSPLAVSISESSSFHDICRFLNGNEDIITARDSINDLNVEIVDVKRLMASLKKLTFDNKEEYHDKSAVHLGIERVLNAMYGGEKGNDIFIVYPAAHIVSQYNFLNKYADKKEKNLTSPQNSDAFNNDLYVWNKNESKGMNIDAGIVFISENVQVDKNSGSQYEVDNLENLAEITNKKGNNDDNTKFKKSENTMKSREYWEKYFSENSKYKPSKIVYYDANMTPTEALNDWKLKNNINGDNIGARDVGNGVGVMDNTKARLDAIGTRTDEIGFGENKVERSDFKRSNGDEEAMHFHRLALEAMKNEYSLDQLLVAYDPNFFSRPEDEWDEIINKMYNAQRVDV